jgi:hypothetical protein
VKDSGKHFGTFKLKWALVVYLIIVGVSESFYAGIFSAKSKLYH